MINLIDTHVHPIIIKNLYKNKNNVDKTYDSIISEAKKNNIEKIICVSTTLNDLNEHLSLSEKYNFVYFTVGIHPCNIDIINLEGQIKESEKYISSFIASKKNIVAIGEVGIDLYHDETQLKEQIYIFEKFIEFSIKYNLPLIIHTRNASQITFDILNSYKNQNIKGVIHCFNEDIHWAKQFVSLGFYLGIGGIITYPKNKHICEAIIYAGINKIVYETDAPFLPPQSKRGEINIPNYLHEVNLFVSNLYNLSEEKCAKIIYQNTIDLFKFI